MKARWGDVKTTIIYRGGSRAGKLDTPCGALSSCILKCTLHNDVSGASVIERPSSLYDEEEQTEQAI